MKSPVKANILIFTLAALILWGCEAPVENLVGPSASGNTIGLKALYGSGGLRANGASQATIRVEVFDTSGQGVTATVTLTTTLGTLGSSSLTTASGFAVTTLTAGTTTGTAFIVATVDNVSATAAVPIVTF